MIIDCMVRDKYLEPRGKFRKGKDAHFSKMENDTESQSDSDGGWKSNAHSVKGFDGKIVNPSGYNGHSNLGYSSEDDSDISFDNWSPKTSNKISKNDRTGKPPNFDMVKRSDSPKMKVTDRYVGYDDSKLMRRDSEPLMNPKRGHS